MEISLLVQVLGSAAMVYCGAIFLLSAGMFFIDRNPAQKASLQPTRTDQAHAQDHEDRENRRAA